MPTHRVDKYTEEDILKAKTLFLRGQNYSQIAREVNSWTGKSTCSAALVKYWAERGKEDHTSWIDEKNRMLATVNEETIAVVHRDLMRRVNIQLDAYRKMVEKGLNNLDGVTPDRMSEVVELIDKGIKGERQISSGLVSLQYIEKVVQIISEEVKDEDTKRRIANRMRKMTEDIIAL